MFLVFQYSNTPLLHYSMIYNIFTQLLPQSFVKHIFIRFIFAIGIFQE